MTTVIQSVDVLYNSLDATWAQKRTASLKKVLSKLNCWNRETLHNLGVCFPQVEEGSYAKLGKGGNYFK